VRVVLDTNVFISGVFFSGPPCRILEAWRDGEITLVASAEILEEYRRVGRVLATQFGGVDIEPVLALVALGAEIVLAPALPERACKDPDDDKFIACALAGRCKVIVSGDKALQEASGYRAIHIMSPRRFMEGHLQR
jgi:putative PIN family toxin of toxin-antitoxin system